MTAQQFFCSKEPWGNTKIDEIRDRLLKFARVGMDGELPCSSHEAARVMMDARFELQRLQDRPLRAGLVYDLDGRQILDLPEGTEARDRTPIAAEIYCQDDGTDVVLISIGRDQFVGAANLVGSPLALETVFARCLHGVRSITEAHDHLATLPGLS